MKLLVFLMSLASLALAATGTTKNPHKLRLKGDPISDSPRSRATKGNYKSFGWRMKFEKFCGCQREIYDSFEDIFAMARVDYVSWSRCDEIKEQRRKPQISYQGSPHIVGLLSMVDDSGAYSLSLELAKELSAKDKSKSSRKYFGAGDRTFKFTRKSEYNYDMELEVQSETEPFKESFTMKNLNKLKEADAEKLMSSLLQATIAAHFPDEKTTPGKLKALLKQCLVHMGMEDDTEGIEPAKRIELIKKLQSDRGLEYLQETYGTCFGSKEIANFTNSPFVLIERCVDSVKP